MEKHLKPQEKPGEFLPMLRARGLVHDETPKAEEYLKSSQEKGEVPKAYAGFDPSAPSLQVGNLVPVLLLRRAQLYGIQPLVLIGGATGMIGDPSGKKAERNLLEVETIRENEARFVKQLSKFVDLAPGKFQAQLVNNYEWFKDFGFLDFLRNVGKHISVNYMLAKDSVKLRMDTGISYAEFGYMLVQGYDFLHLFEKFGCRMQLGGSDQWGNITTGMELIRRKHQEEAYAISTPLLTDSAGNKLGKSEGGAVFIDPNLTTPYQFHQYWINQADADVLRILRTLTLLSDEYIDELQTDVQERPEQRKAQNVLAHDLTSLVHGEEAALAAERAAKVLFSKKPESLDLIDAKTLEFLEAEVPSSDFSDSDSLEITELLVRTGLVKSKGEARRHIKGNAVSINREKVQDEKLVVRKEQFAERGFILVGLGKSKLHLIVKR